MSVFIVFFEIFFSDDTLHNKRRKQQVLYLSMFVDSREKAFHIVYLWLSNDCLDDRFWYCDSWENKRKLTVIEFENCLVA